MTNGGMFSFYDEITNFIETVIVYIFYKRSLFFLMTLNANDAS